MDFPPILIINLHHRKDRWKQITSQLDSHGVQYERVDAIKHKEGWKGASLSHKKCYEIAKERKYPWVLILEDDCLFQKNGMRRFRELLPLLWEKRPEWDVFTGGSVNITKACRIQTNPPLFELISWSAHFVLAHESAYDKLIKMIDLGHCPDCFRRVKIRSWATYPHIATQQPGYSDINHGMKNTRKNFGFTDKLLKKVLHTRKRCMSRKQIKTMVRAENF
jgi:GR25 family glycosyltransferase involved in LPS biosynthesis